MNKLAMIGAASVVALPAFAESGAAEIEAALEACEDAYFECEDAGTDPPECDETALDCLIDVALDSGATEEDLFFCEDIYIDCAEGDLEDWDEDFDDEDWDEEDFECEDEEGCDFDEFECEDENEDCEDLADGFICEEVLVDCLIASAFGEEFDYEDDWDDEDDMDLYDESDMGVDEGDMGADGLPGEFSSTDSELNTGDIAVDEVNVSCTSATGKGNAGMLGFLMMGLAALRRRR